MSNNERTRERKIENQNDFEYVYDFHKALTGAGVDHILSPCHPLKRYKKKLWNKMMENGTEELQSRLNKSNDK